MPTILEIRQDDVPAFRALAAAAATDDARPMLTTVNIEAADGRDLDTADRLLVWACDSYRLHRYVADAQTKPHMRDLALILLTDHLSIDLDAAHDTGAVRTYNGREIIAIPADLFRVVTGKGDRHRFTVDLDGTRPKRVNDDEDDPADTRQMVAHYGTKDRAAPMPVPGVPPNVKQLWPDLDDYPASIDVDPVTMAAVERPLRYMSQAGEGDSSNVLTLSVDRDDDDKPTGFHATKRVRLSQSYGTPRRSPSMEMRIDGLTVDVAGPVPGHVSFNAGFLSAAVAAVDAQVGRRSVIRLRLRGDNDDGSLKPTVIHALYGGPFAAMIMPVRL